MRNDTGKVLPSLASLLLLNPARGLYVGHYPPQPVFVLWPTPTLSPTLLKAVYFEPTFSHIISYS